MAQPRGTNLLAPPHMQEQDSISSCSELPLTASDTDDVRPSNNMGNNRQSVYGDIMGKKRFEAFFMGPVICLNILALAGETDHPEWVIWSILDNCFLIVFVVELAVRLQHEGMQRFLCGKERLWNTLDAVIVLLGVLDLWIAPVVIGMSRTASPANHLTGGSAALRFLRLLRLLRLLRVFKMVKKLAAFVEAIKSMLGPFCLVLVVLFGCNLFVSIILTHILGHGEDLDEDTLQSDVYAEVRAHFRDVPTSFFTLFQIMTMDNWNSVAQPVISLGKAWRIFFVIFILFCGWTMTSILTAVASDNVISATMGKQEQERIEKEKRTKEFYRLLRRMFEDGDKDGNNLLDKEEFETLLDTEDFSRLLVQADIHVQKEELAKMWDTIDVAGTGVLTIDEFVDGLAYLQEDQISTKHIVGIDYSIRRLASDLEKKVESMSGRAASWRGRNLKLLETLHQQEQVLLQQNQALWLWQQWAAKNAKRDSGLFPAELLEYLNAEALKGPPTAPMLVQERDFSGRRSQDFSGRRSQDSKAAPSFHLPPG